MGSVAFLEWSDDMLVAYLKKGIQNNHSNLLLCLQYVTHELGNVLTVCSNRTTTFLQLKGDLNFVQDRTMNHE